MIEKTIEYVAKLTPERQVNVLPLFDLSVLVTLESLMYAGLYKRNPLDVYKGMDRNTESEAIDLLLDQTNRMEWILAGIERLPRDMSLNDYERFVFEWVQGEQGTGMEDD